MDMRKQSFCQSIDGVYETEQSKIMISLGKFYSKDNGFHEVQQIGKLDD